MTRLTERLTKFSSPDMLRVTLQEMDKEDLITVSNDLGIILGKRPARDYMISEICKKMLNPVQYLNLYSVRSFKGRVLHS